MQQSFSTRITLTFGLMWGLGIQLGFLNQTTYAAEILPPVDSSTLTLEMYLMQVRENNLGVKSALNGVTGGKLRSEEGKLLLAPTPYADLKFVSDSKIQPFSFLLFSNLATDTISLGVSQLTTFGLQAKLHYDMYTQTYNNPQIDFPFPVPSSLFSYANAAPVLELTQNLWSNWAGKSTRATQDQMKANALASSYSNSFQVKSDLAEAESNYWRLAEARQTVLVETSALDRAQKIYEWNSRRARLHLGDEADVLQAEALVKSRELDLLSAQNEERSASLAFNTSRNIETDQVSEKLVDLDPEMIETLRIPKRAEMRDDVKAAEQNSRASIARSQVAIEQDTPSLNLYASAALNGQQTSYFTALSDSIANSFTLNRPTFTVELTFSTPFDFSTNSHAKEGWRLEHVAAELNFDRKLFEQEQTWKDLNQSLSEARQRFSLSRKLEFIQKTKLEKEKERLRHGRTTTYQVLLFEQDYLQAQLLRIQNQAAILKIIAQMKLFGENV